jgi:ribonucleoside-diphosphate reductase alpha chain
MLRVFNDTARYVDHGGKRKGPVLRLHRNLACRYFRFLRFEKNTGKEEMRARDLFFAMWTIDLFMKRWPQRDQLWTLMCRMKIIRLYDIVW